MQSIRAAVAAELYVNRCSLLGGEAAVLIPQGGARLRFQLWLGSAWPVLRLLLELLGLPSALQWRGRACCRLPVQETEVFVRLETVPRGAQVICLLPEGFYGRDVVRLWRSISQRHDHCVIQRLMPEGGIEVVAQGGSPSAQLVPAK